MNIGGMEREKEEGRRGRGGGGGEGGMMRCCKRGRNFGSYGKVRGGTSFTSNNRQRHGAVTQFGKAEMMVAIKGGDFHDFDRSITLQTIVCLSPLCFFRPDTLWLSAESIQIQAKTRFLDNILPVSTYPGSSSVEYSVEYYDGSISGGEGLMSNRLTCIRFLWAYWFTDSRFIYRQGFRGAQIHAGGK